MMLVIASMIAMMRTVRPDDDGDSYDLANGSNDEEFGARRFHGEAVELDFGDDDSDDGK